MHLKNFAVLYQENGIHLSPAYDLLNVNLINPDDQEELALTLNAKKNKIRLNDFIVLGEGLKIPAPALKNVFYKFQTNNKEVEVMIDHSFLSKEAKERYKEIWQKKQEIFE